VVLTLTRMDGLAAGSLIALVVRGQSGEGLLQWWGRVLVVPLTIGGILLGVQLGGFKPAHPLMQSVGYTLLVLWFGSVLLTALAARRRSAVARILEQPWLHTLGKFSYALYLVHLPVKMVLEPWFYRPEPIVVLRSWAFPTQVLFTLSGLLLSLLAALVSWHFLEKHFLSMKRYFEANSTLSPAEPPLPVGTVGPTALAQMGRTAPRSTGS
jgi:peptidoglycan/LPS O-acetylase OafA/YrhL